MYKTTMIYGFAEGTLSDELELKPFSFFRIIYVSSPILQFDHDGDLAA
jgi:hypothetical protein